MCMPQLIARVSKLCLHRARGLLPLVGMIQLVGAKYKTHVREVVKIRVVQGTKNDAHLEFLGNRLRQPYEVFFIFLLFF